MSMDVLESSLLDLAVRLRSTVGPLTVIGGFGLYLKQIHRQAQPDLRMLIPGEFWPPARATEDIDLLLSTDVVTSARRMQAIRDALDTLGYTSVVKFMHFQMPTARGSVRVDLLTGPIVREDQLAQVKIKPPRVRPKEGRDLHAYLMPEAIRAEVGSMMLSLSGVLSDGQPATTDVRLPGAFTMLLMKLHAFRDRLDDRKQLARYHALDLYRIVAMLTRDEYDEVRDQLARPPREPVVRDGS